jgi:hypothetical protein
MSRNVPNQTVSCQHFQQHNNKNVNFRSIAERCTSVMCDPPLEPSNTLLKCKVKMGSTKFRKYVRRTINSTSGPNKPSSTGSFIKYALLRASTILWKKRFKQKKNKLNTFPKPYAHKENRAKNSRIEDSFPSRKP